MFNFALLVLECGPIAALFISLSTWTFSLRDRANASARTAGGCIVEGSLRLMIGIKSTVIFGGAAFLINRRVLAVPLASFQARIQACKGLSNVLHSTLP
jgi:hypothetical protein